MRSLHGSATLFNPLIYKRALSFDDYFDRFLVLVGPRTEAAKVQGDFTFGDRPDLKGCNLGTNTGRKQTRNHDQGGSSAEGGNIALNAFPGRRENRVSLFAPAPNM